MVTWMSTPRIAYQHSEELLLAGMHRVGSCPTGLRLLWPWRKRLNSLSLNVTRRRSCRRRCGRRASEMVALRSRRSTSS